MLGIVDTNGRTVVADLEAGIGTITRLRDAVDLVLLVVEPTPKSIEVGARAAAFVQERGFGRVMVIGNKVRDADDERVIRDAFAGHAVALVPDDRAIVDAERRGIAPLDGYEDAPAVRALAVLAAGLRT